MRKKKGELVEKGVGWWLQRDELYHNRHGQIAMGKKEKERERERDKVTEGRREGKVIARKG